MKERIAARTAASVAVLSAGLVLAGCGSNQGAQMTPQEARDQLVEVVKATAEQVTPDGWSDMGSPTWGACSVGGGDGVKSSWYYTHEPLSDHDTNAQKVAEYWKSLGMDVRVVNDPTISVYAEGGAATAISFHTEPGLYTVSGTSVCVPGTPEDMIRQEKGIG
jgi:hypothetical protein